MHYQSTTYETDYQKGKSQNKNLINSQSDMLSFQQEFEQKLYFSNLPEMVMNCTKLCCEDTSLQKSMYLNREEKECVSVCFDRSFKMLAEMNKEVPLLVRSM